MKRSAVFLSLLVGVGVCDNVLAQPTILDQHNDTWESIVRVQNSLEYAQTFTPTVSGFLNRIEILGARNAYFESFPLSMYFYNTSGGRPIGQPLASQTFSSISSDYYTTLALDLSSSGIFVQQDVVYAFTITCPNSFYGVAVQASLYDPYLEGSLWVRTASAAPWTHDTEYGSSDVLFWEYVTVPEPTAFALFVSGVLLLGIHKRNACRNGTHV
jgi:hypothetical protein